MKPATLALIGLLATGGALADPAPDAAPAAAPVPSPPTLSGPGIVLVDGRLALDGHSENMSYGVGNCNNGIRRLGDEGNVPLKMKLLKQDLDSQLGAAWAGRTVWVSRYAAYFNVSVQAHAGAAAMGGPFMGWIVAKDNDACKEYTYGGWYALDEITTKNPPLVVEAIVYVDYKPYSVRAVYSPEEDLRGEFGVGLFSFSISDYSPAATDALTAALHLANGKIAEQLRGH